MTSSIFTVAAVAMVLSAAGCAVTPAGPSGSEETGAASSAATTEPSAAATASPDTSRPTLQALVRVSDPVNYAGVISFSGAGFTPSGQVLVNASSADDSVNQWQWVTAAARTYCIKAPCAGDTGEISGTFTHLGCGVEITLLAIDGDGRGESNTVTLRTMCSTQ